MPLLVVLMQSKIYINVIHYKRKLRLECERQV